MPDDAKRHVRITGAEDAPNDLNFAERYVYARIRLGYPVAPQDESIERRLRERGLFADGHGAASCTCPFTMDKEDMGDPWCPVHGMSSVRFHRDGQR